jgi:hypothetical protein
MNNSELAKITACIIVGVAIGMAFYTYVIAPLAVKTVGAPATA